MVTNTDARAWSDLPIPPGELLQEELDAIGMTQQRLAMLTGRPAQVINEIIRGKKQITHETALELERVLGLPAHIWVNLEADYQLTSARLREQEELRKQEDWLQEFPVRELEKRAWIPKCKEKIDRVRELLKFLGVASFSAWSAWRETVLQFRITSRANVSAGALAVWLRKGELDGRDAETLPYDEAKFRQALATIRALTTETPDVFEPELKKLCASAGVAVVFTPELPKSGAHGAARWLTDDTALIQLSLRYKTNDHLWFSFFHEACHVLLHLIRDIHIDTMEGDDRIFDIRIDGIEGDDSAEAEADRFAEDTLIPPDAWAQFVEAGSWDSATVQRFASEIDVAPGIVVGRLQHDGIVGWSSTLNRLKVRFNWIEE